MPRDPRALPRPAAGRRTGRTVTRGWPSATTLFAIDASSPAEAELRVLAWINHTYEDDLRQATAAAEHQAGPHQWRHVSLRILGE